MPAAMSPVDEAARIASLHRLRVLDSEQESAFQELTELAAETLSAPIAVISLVDSRREWFKACVGTDLKQADRRIAFCAHTILHHEPLLVPDATLDPRFADNPQVTEGGIRSYAGAPIISAEGKCIGAFCIKDFKPRAFNEVTNRHLIRFARICAYMLETRLAKLTSEDASRSKSEFLANMSHEIRTPMTAIIGFANLLAEETAQVASAPRFGEYVDTIRHNGTHLLAIINDILDLSKIEAGKLEIELVEFGLVELLAEVSASMRLRAEQQGIALLVEYETAMPQRVKSDPVRLRQMVLNLLSNAIKFTERGAVRLSVGVAPVGEASELTIRVKDTGIGMTAEQVAALFGAFQQADAGMTRRFGGTGLGLRITKRLANLLGGDVNVSSAFGEGSAFELRIPLECVTHSDQHVAAECAPAPVARMQSGAVVGTADLVGTRILLVEDGPDNQRLLTFLLRKAGATVEVAEHGAVALDMLCEGGALRSPLPFDLIISDMQMPVMDGYALATALKSLGLNRPIIALTAHAMAGNAERCIAAGCDYFHTKPIDRETLVNACRTALERAATLVGGE